MNQNSEDNHKGSSLLAFVFVGVASWEKISTYLSRWWVKVAMPFLGQLFYAALIVLAVCAAAFLLWKLVAAAFRTVKGFFENINLEFAKLNTRCEDLEFGNRQLWSHCHALSQELHEAKIKIEYLIKSTVPSPAAATTQAPDGDNTSSTIPCDEIAKAVDA